ncbi:ClC family H(+)/Cl(-) exchange transporter [Aerococcus kribbianus]|uniref:ClC family H(+)/Cl(-) exchange transporter n=1 Tax=Aerococcus kribbianus TaxID=2999064 RepID=A0A9X3JEZ0_9LACT|nr:MULTISPECIES: ClC family H(+)/Cl(-) exchange transporter [unclassified Aerococcus]MCZ0717664.1 ClC family H(+)/Cl(-) exchange transporter [Aerococcus sp. YH-aer221]MCZ0725952.1 ClC family H(+)/Cl(-) exchange transporter [Aerococcus sp. YH-aer222]
MKERNINMKRLIVDSIFVGLLSGLGSVAYRLFLESLTGWQLRFFTIDSWWQLLFILVVMWLLAKLVAYLLKLAPYSGGSGIPQIHAELDDKISDRPLPTLLSKFLGGGINNFLGLSLGREGPSIQIGGMVAKLLAIGDHRSPSEKKYLIAAGASAGLSAAFNAPIAGTLFTVEEMYHSFAAPIVLPALIASVVANFVSFYLIGVEPAFTFIVDAAIPLDQYYWIIIVGLMGGLVGSLFNIVLDYNQRLFQGWKMSTDKLLFLVFILSLLVSQSFPYLMGGGHDLVELLVENAPSIGLILVILIGNMLFTTASYASGAQGGIFLPVLLIGAATGVLVHQVALVFAPIELPLVNFLILGMVAVLCAVVRSPFMSILLISEMTSNPNTLMPLAIAAIIAAMLAEFLQVKPVYTMLYLKLMGQEEKS